VEGSPLRSEELPIPEPGPGQVRIRVLMCGVCHTDLHMAEGEIHPPVLPRIPGHQVVGIVDKMGQAETRSKLPDQSGQVLHMLQIGQRVGVPWLYRACGSCEFCRRDQENLCPQAQFTGFHVDGGYAGYMLADVRYVLPIPEDLNDEQAAPLLCAGIVGYRSLKKAEILPGERVGLYGFGASAHLSIQVLRYWGCRVWVFTRSKAHQEHALQLGAVWAGDVDARPEQPLDRAVIFAPAGELAVHALEQVRPAGTVAINAIHTSDIPSFPYQKIYGERTLRSVANATYRDGQEFLTLAVAAQIQATVKCYPLNDANRALQDLKASRFNGEAVLQVAP
jgi:propanol-preferring alcohol dehydrogenase